MAKKNDKIVKELLALQKNPQFLKEIEIFIKKSTK
jgi:hypothetical protein